MKIIGFHLDLKAQMPKFSYICKIINRIADMGYNTLLLEYQDKFPYSGELSPLASPDALTIGQIEEIKKLCRSRNIEIIPMMQCLGHMYWVTRFDKYAQLGEHFPEKGKGSHSLCASKKESFELFKELAGQVMSLHGDSKYFHIGADEVKFSDSCPLCASRDKGEILAEHYLNVIEYVKKKDYTPVMWGDMVLKYEGLADKLPKDTVIMDWDYCGGLSEKNGRDFYGGAFTRKEDTPVAFESSAVLSAKGFSVICAPAVRSMGDTVFMPRNAHLDNCVQAVFAAKQSGASGVIVTSWAVRRVPHILTEPILECVAMLCKNGKLTYNDMLRLISEKYLGTASGDIPFRFAELLSRAQESANLLSSGQDFMDAESGMFLSDSVSKRLGGREIMQNREIYDAYSALSKGCDELLQAITDFEFSEYSKILSVSLKNAGKLGNIFAALSKEPCDMEALRTVYEDIDILKAFTDIMASYYTNFSMPTEYMARYDVYKEYVQQLLTNNQRSAK